MFSRLANHRASWMSAQRLPPLVSTLRRIRIVSVTVLVLNPALLIMYNQFSLLVASNLPPPVDGVLLAVENLGIALGALATYSPPLFARDDMLIAFCHDFTPLKAA